MLAQDMKERSEAVMAQVKHLSDKSNMNQKVLQEASGVVDITATMLAAAQKLQAAVADSLIEADAKAAKATFYRKNFSKAKGCINEIHEIVDATSLLFESTTKAVSGEADIEQVRLMSQSPLLCLSMRCRSCRTSRTSRRA